MMQHLSVNGVLYIIKRTFSFEQVKNEDALFSVKHFYGADHLIKDNTNQKYILAAKIDDAVILEDTETKQ